jgi:hypothetical protein
MNKLKFFVFITIFVSILDRLKSFTNSNSKFLIKNTKKEILTPNNLEDIYQTNIQKEFVNYFNLSMIKLATSDFKCQFRCNSNIKEKLIQDKYKEHDCSFEEKSINLIHNIDLKYYCTDIKHLYFVKLYKIILKIVELQM